MDQSSRTDRELLRGARRHPEAFGNLYDRHAEPVYRWARRAGLPEADAFDLVEARARARLHIEQIHEPDVSDAIAERLDAAAAGPKLELAMSALAGAHRDAVRLRVVEGLAHPDIAIRLGCTVTTARKWVSLGLRGLRDRLETTP
jgi:DNA-directed RNA polymerase specialized sigma24 family protein